MHMHFMNFQPALVTFPIGYKESDVEDYFQCLTDDFDLDSDDESIVNVMRVGGNCSGYYLFKYLVTYWHWDFMIMRNQRAIGRAIWTVGRFLWSGWLADENLVV